MYKVIVKFADLEDRKHIYQEGDVYPRKGSEPTDERIAFLASDKNKLGTPVIEFVPEPKKPEQEVAPKKKSGKKSIK